MLEVHNLSIRYSDSDECLFRDLSFKLNAGSLLWVKGPNGCGKTSLLYALANIIPQHINALRDGIITLEGKALTDVPISQLMPDLALSMQNTAWQLLFPSIEEELIYALENLGLSDEEIETRLAAALSRFNLTSYKNSHPNQLSGGFQKLLSLAIIDTISPQLILLDEPFNGLSDSNIQIVNDWLKNMQLCGKIMIIADHFEGLADLCTHQLEFESDGFVCG